MDEILKRDQNHVTVLAGVTNDVDKDIVILRVDPITKRLLVSLPGGGGGSGWSLTGNAGTTPGTNFVGTTDAQDLVFKTNSFERFRIETFINGAYSVFKFSGNTIDFLNSNGNSMMSFDNNNTYIFSPGGTSYAQLNIDGFNLDGPTNLNLKSSSQLRFYNGANYVGFQPGVLSSNIIWTLPTSDSTGTQALVSNGSGTLSWSSILPVSDYKLIPFMNAAEDSYDFDRDFLYDPQIQRLEILSNNTNNDGALDLEIDVGTKIAVFNNRLVVHSAEYHISEDFSFGVAAPIGSFGSDPNIGFYVKYTSEDTDWGQALYVSVDQFVYNPRYYLFGDSTVFFGGDTSSIHITGHDKNGTPSIALGTGAGTGATASIEGTDMGMRIVITTGTTPAANATVATITFATGYNFRPFVVASAGNVTSAARAAVMHFDAPDENTFTIKVGATALTASAGYVWNIHVIGREAV